MVGKSVLTNHKTVRGRGGLILMAPHKNWTTALFLPTDRPAIEAWRGAMAAVKMLMVDEECCLSSISCRNERTTDTLEVTRSKS